MVNYSRGPCCVVYSDTNVIHQSVGNGGPSCWLVPDVLFILCKVIMVGGRFVCLDFLAENMSWGVGDVGGGWECCYIIYYYWTIITNSNRKSYRKFMLRHVLLICHAALANQCARWKTCAWLRNWYKGLNTQSFYIQYVLCPTVQVIMAFQLYYCFGLLTDT